MSDPTFSHDVSVIVAVRNDGDLIGNCLESIKNQRGCSIELIVVDCMSTDTTPDVVHEFRDVITHYLREPDDGIYDAWNKALALCTGEWCAFLGADDKFISQDSVAQLLDCARSAAPSTVVAFGGVVMVGGAWDYPINSEIRAVSAHLLSGRMIPHTASLTGTEALREVGGFDASFRILGDHDVTLRLLESGSAVRCERYVVSSLIGGISTAWEWRWSRRRELFRVLAGRIGLFKASRLLVKATIREEAGGVLERSLLLLCGRKRARRILLSLRRRVGRSPQLKLLETPRSLSARSPA